MSAIVVTFCVSRAFKLTISARLLQPSNTFDISVTPAVLVSAANVTVTANDAVITEKTTSSKKSDNSGTSNQNNTGFASEDNRTANEQTAE